MIVSLESDSEMFIHRERQSVHQQQNQSRRQLHLRHDDRRTNQHNRQQAT